jgi:hypothetical protein
MSGGGNTVGSHYSSSTQPYGNTASSKIAYHNVDAYGASNAGSGDALGYSSGNGGNGVRAQSPYAHAGKYGRDDYGGSTQAPQRGNDRGDAGLRSSRVDYSSSQYQDRDRDRAAERYDGSSSAGGPFTPTKAAQKEYLSPRGDRDVAHASSRHAQSPVVDRVSAALAARAAAESAKSALKYAQLQRNAQTSRHHAGSSAVTVSPPRVATNHVNVGDRRPPSAGPNGSSSSGAYSSSMSQSSSTSALGGGASSDNASMTAAESIRRTQQLLARRGVVAGADSSVPDSNAGGSDRTPNSGRGATKLTETIQHANTMYPPSPQHRHDSR